MVTIMSNSKIIKEIMYSVCINYHPQSRLKITRIERLTVHLYLLSAKGIISHIYWLVNCCCSIIAFVKGILSNICLTPKQSERASCSFSILPPMAFTTVDSLWLGKFGKYNLAIFKVSNEYMFAVIFIRFRASLKNDKSKDEL